MTRSATVGFALALAAAACNARGASTAAPADAEPEATAQVVEVPDAASGADASSSASPAIPPIHRRGFVGMFFRAAHDTDLTEEQKTAIGKLEEPFQGEPPPRREMTALHTDLVASVKEGRIDTAKLAADEAAVAKMLSSREEEQATALAGLHDALTPAQRGAVADAVRAARERPQPPAPPPVATAAADWATRRLEHMKSQLVLDQDQQKQVAAVLAREAPTPATVQAHREAVKKQTEAVARAFESDTFDAKKIDLSATPGRRSTEGFDRQIKYVSSILPILTSGQRDRFAALMEHPQQRAGAARGDSITEAPDPAGGGGGR
jgi:Spy/CpxP family protein refolding chaperone